MQLAILGHMKKPNRKLVVRREILQTLVGTKLAHVVAGNDAGLPRQSGAEQCTAPAIVNPRPAG